MTAALRSMAAPRPSVGGRPGTGPAGPAGRRPSPARGRGCEGLLRSVEAFAVLFLEVEAGWRPRGQLAPLMTPMLYARLDGIWVRGGPLGEVIDVHGAPVSAARWEAVAVVRRGARCGALAMALLRTCHGWRVTDVARPEDGPLPAPPYPVPDDSDEDAGEAQALRRRVVAAEWRAAAPTR